jgi:hypothetical protein
MEESIVKVVQLLTDECATRQIDSSPALVAYTVRSIITSRIGEFQVDVSKPLTDEQAGKLREWCLGMLQDQTSLPMLTIRMQVDMDLGLAQSERSQKQRDAREADHRSAIEQELLSIRARSAAALESFYRKIVSYTIISSRWGSPNDPQCVRQATAALEQVFPPSEVPKFILSSEEDKRRRLQEYCKLVLGIRVFQTFGGDMADPAANFRLDIPRKLDALRARIQTSIEGIGALVLRYGEVLRDESTEDPQRLTDELINRQQFLFFYELLMARLGDLSRSLEQSCSEFDSLMDNLRNLMELSESLPTAKAAPLFAALATVWQLFQGYEDGIRNLELLLARLRKHRDTFVPTLGAAAPDSPVVRPEREVEAVEATPLPLESDIAADDARPILVKRDVDGEFAFNGFCPVTLVMHDGLLLPGDVVLGSVRWERRYYAFVDTAARTQFQSNPAKWHNDAMAVARKHPELVSLLGLQSEFPTLPAPRIPVKAKIPEPPNLKYRSMSTETDVHPVDSYFDRTYHWNQWELMKRKKILKGLENKRTRGSQTKGSHFTRESESQTFERRDKDEQTRVESGVEMPRTVRYIAGLRGDSQTSAKIVTLSLILGKPQDWSLRASTE